MINTISLCQALVTRLTGRLVADLNSHLLTAKLLDDAIQRLQHIATLAATTRLQLAGYVFQVPVEREQSREDSASLAQQHVI